VLRFEHCQLAEARAVIRSLPVSRRIPSSSPHQPPIFPIPSFQTKYISANFAGNFVEIVILVLGGVESPRTGRLGPARFEAGPL